MNYAVRQHLQLYAPRKNSNAGLKFKVKGKCAIRKSVKVNIKLLTSVDQSHVESDIKAVDCEVAVVRNTLIAQTK